MENTLLKPMEKDITQTDNMKVTREIVMELVNELDHDGLHTVRVFLEHYLDKPKFDTIRQAKPELSETLKRDPATKCRGEHSL